ncbi:hypothetical protein V7182_24850, partial [Neobacillus drentensis]|uniref:hypothetical protein n=1 Tax=Neobacillus drentensis TaxID=220684 RepID=UPI002FFECE28
FVCQACSLTWRCKSAMGVGICEPLAEGKGVRGDAESEGSPRQILGLRYTNHIRGSLFQDESAKQDKVQNIPGWKRE